MSIHEHETKSIECPKSNSGEVAKVIRAFFANGRASL
jgi:hypothetical protein